MKKYLLLIAGMCSAALSFATAGNTIRISASTTVNATSSVQVAANVTAFQNDGLYTDNSGTFNVLAGMTFSGSGTTNLYNLVVNNGGSSVFSSTVSVNNTATLTSGNVNAGSLLLWIRSDLNASASIVNNASLTGTVKGLVTNATVTTGGCPSYTSVLSLNISGSSMVYQWQSSPDNSAWSDVTGATNVSYTPTVTATAYYRCNLTTNNTAYAQATPGVQLIFTGSFPTIGATGALFCAGSGPGTISATGGTTYTWAPATGLSATVGASVSANPSITTTYTVTGTTGGCSGTAIALVTVNQRPVTSSIGSNSPVCVNSALNLTNTTTGGTGTLVYAWTGPNTFSSTSSTPSISSVTTAAGGTYSLAITDDNGCTATGTHTTAVTVNVQPVISSIGNNGPVCATFALNLTSSASVGQAPYTYAWSGPNSFASTAQNPIIGSATTSATGTYTLVVTDANGCSTATPGTTAAVVNPRPVIDTINTNSPVCTGVALTFGTTASGGTGSLTYLWNGPISYSNTNQNPTISSAITSNSGIYTLTVTDGVGCHGTGTNTISATVNPRPTLSAIGNNGPICANTTLNLTSTSSGGAAPLTYAWSGPATFSATTANTSITGAATTATGIYTLIVTDNNSCTATGTNTTAATVNPRAVINTISNNGPICSGFNLNLGSTASGGTPTLTYSWSGPNSFTSSVASPSISAATTAATGIYTLTVSDPNSCVASGVNTTSATVNPIPVLVAIGNNGPVCATNDLNLNSTVTGGTAPLAYAWSGPNTFASTATNPVITAATTAATGTYTLVVTDANGCIPTAANTTAAVVNPLPATITGNGNVCFGLTTTLSDATGTGTWSSSDPSTASVTTGGVVSGVTVGMATISYTLATGCYLTKDVTVNQTPAAISGPTSICAGANITLSTTPAGGTWSSTNVSVATIDINTGVMTGLNAGTTNVTYTSDKGCVIGTSVPVSNPISAIVGNTGTCIGLFFTLTDATSGGTWSSSDIAVVTVGATTGLVTAVGGGVATVTYTVGGCYRIQPMTISTTPPAITGNTSLCIGNTSALADGITGGSWSSSASTIASVVTSSGVVTGLLAGSANITYSLSATCRTSITVSVDPSPVVTGNQIVCFGTTNSFTGAPTGGAWSSSNAATASVDATGNVTGVATGVAYITYTVGSGCYKVTTVTVSPLPAAISGPTLFCVGGVNVVTDPTSGGMLWSSSNTAVASIGTASGVITGLSAGTTAITFTLTTGCINTVTITVNAAVATLAGTPVVCQGLTTALSSAPAGGVWSSTVPAIASVDASGLVTGNYGGTAIVSYTQPGVGCYKIAVVTVNPSPNVITGPTTFCAGSNGTLASLTTGGTWTSGNTTVATVISTSGVVSGLTAGTSIISYMVSTGCQATTTITVTSGNPITGTMTVCPGLTTALASTPSGGVWASDNTAVATVNSASGVVAGITSGTANITYTPSPGCATATVVTVSTAPANITGTTNVVVNNNITLSNTTSGGTWSSSDVTLGTVDAATGVVTGIAPGTVIISYTVGSCYKTISIVVNPLPDPISGNPTVCVGLNTVLTNPAVGLSWTSSNTAVATIGITSGVATGLSTGTTIITYTALTGGYTTIVITVNPQPGSIVGASSVCAGATTTFTNGTPGGTWSSSNTSYAGVDVTTGLVTGIFNGTSVITYSISGCIAIKGININPLPNTITGPALVCMGFATTLNEVTTGGTWSSAATGTATIGSTGIVTPVSTGIVTISYTLASGCARTTDVTVSTMPANTGTATACTAATTTLANTAPSGTWSSGSTAIATVVPTTGVVTGVSTGNAVITYTLTAGCRATTTVNVISSPSNVTGPTSVCMNAGITLADGTAGGTWASSDATLATVVTGTGAVTGILAGTPAISYIAPNGCVKTYNVTVKPLPVPIVGNTAICVSGTVTVTDPTPVGSSWGSSNTAIATIGAGSGLVTGVTAGNANITYTINTGCFIIKEVTVSAAVSAGTVTGPASVSKAASVSLPISYTDGVTGGTWTTSNTSKATITATTGLLTGVSAGAVTISYRALTGCYATLPITITTPRDADNNMNVTTSSIELFPNPTSGTFNIKTATAGTFSIYTLEGKEVERYQVTEGANILNMPHGLASGIYMCKFSGDDGTAVTVRLVYKP